jgi:hypothetical protein
MRIPAICHNERIWWEQLGKYTVSYRQVGDRDIQFIVEETTEGFVHSCTVDDLCRILQLAPPGDWEGLQTFLLRQPTRKENLLEPSWGRLAHAAEIGQPNKPDIYQGPALILEAINPHASFKWSKSLSPSAKQELDRLKRDGNLVQDHGKYFLISPDINSARATQLYRTVLHEIGHWVEWLERVERPSSPDANSLVDLLDAYWARPSREREAYAHKYADALRTRLYEDGKIPFDRIDPEQSNDAK